MPYTFAYFKDGNRYKSVLGGQFNNSDNGTPQINKDTIVFVGGADVSADDLRDGIYAQGKYFGVGTGSSSSFNLSEHTRFVTDSNSRKYAVQLSNGQMYVNVPWVEYQGGNSGSSSSDTASYEFEVAFAVVIATNTNPIKPVGSIPTTGQLKSDGTRWMKTGPNSVRDGYFTWMTTRSVNVSGAHNEEWGDPFIIGSAGSAGVDGIHGINGDMYEYIYSRTESANSAGQYPYAHPKTITQPDGTSKGKTVVEDDFVPRGWSDNPRGVNETQQYEWVSIRRKTFDADNNGTFSEFSTPSLWSKYGVNGTDGDGIEYIFASLLPTQTQLRYNPATWTVDDTFKYTDEYIPSFAQSEWTDDPIGLTVPGQKIYVSIRKKYSNTGSVELPDSYWHAYSEPKLWAYYSIDGKDGKDADDPTPTHPQNMVIGGNGVDGEEEFNANKNSYLENVMIAVRDKNGVIKFWAMKVSGVWNYVYAPSPTTIPQTTGATLYGGITAWNASEKNKYVVYTIYDREGGKVIGYGINGIYVALPGDQTGMPVYNVVHINEDEWDINNANDGTIYYVDVQDKDNNHRTDIYLGKIKIGSDIPNVMRKSEFTEMFSEGLVANEDDIVNTVWTTINTDDPDRGYLGTYRADLNGAINSIAQLSTSVTNTSSSVSLLASRVDGVEDEQQTIAARLDTVVEWDEDTQSWKAKVISDADEIILQATESITSSVIENVNHEIVDENGEVRTVVDQLVRNQIEQNGKGIFLSAFGDEEGGYKTIGQVGVTGDQITLGALKYNSTSGKYEVDSDTLFTVNLQDNKIVAAADTFVITGDLIADGISTNGLNVGDGKFVVDNDGTVHTNGAVMVGPQVQHSVRTVLTGDRSSISNHVTLGPDIIIVKGNSGMGQAQIVFPPAYLFPGAELRVINAVEDYAIFKFEIGRKDGEQSRAEETGNGNQSMNDFYIAVPFRINGLDTTTYGSHMELEVHECRFIDFVSVPNPEYPNYYVWMVVDVRQENI